MNRVITWLGYLIWQILRGSWFVIRATWNPKPFGSPAIVEYRMRCRSDAEIAFFTSAITITPGTLVVGVTAATAEAPGSVFVHSLFDNDRDRVIAGLSELEWYLLNAMRRGGMKETRP